MLQYSQLPTSKKAFIFELDNVLFPEKDYLLQVYYLFAQFIEYTETVPFATELTDFLKLSYETHGAQGIFDRAKETYNIDEKYRSQFDMLYTTARLPLKLLLFQDALTLLQEIVTDRKQIFIVTNGNPDQQLNKIRQTDWAGLENYLTVFFANETIPKPETNVLDSIYTQHNFLRKELLIIGASEIDREFASAAGIEYLDMY
jgi:FMN phosphatase YigB (HAD superfamily)